MTNEEAIEIIDKGLDIGVQMPFLTVDQMNEAKQMAIKALSEQKTGHWIKRGGLLYCSECDLPSMHNWPYCEQCGAKMESKVEQ